MGHYDSEGSECVYGYRWPGRRTGEYQHFALSRNFYPNIYMPGIPTSEHNLCGNWRSPLGQYSYGSLRPSMLTLRPPHWQAAEDAGGCQDMLIDIFNRIERFFQRLDTYTLASHRLAAMTDVIVVIMVEVINILGIATKEVKRGRLSELMSLIFTILDLHPF